MAKEPFLSTQASKFACMAVSIFPLLSLLGHDSAREHTCASCTGTKLLTNIRVNVNLNVAIESKGWSRMNLRIILSCRWTCLTKYNEQSLVYGVMSNCKSARVWCHEIFHAFHSPLIYFVSIPFKTLRTGLLNCLNARSRGLNFRHRASCI